MITSNPTPSKCADGSFGPAAAEPLRWSLFAPSQASDAMTVWRDLEDRLQSRTISNSSIWTECWVRHYGGHTPFRVVVADARNQVRGVALITEGQGRKAGPVPLRTCHLGTAGEPEHESPFVEYNRILVDPLYQQPFLNGLVHRLWNDGRWDQLRLDGFHERDLQPFLDRLSGATVRRRESRYCDLKRIREQAGSDLLSQLGRSTRTNIRRRLRDYGELEVTWAESPDIAHGIYAELVELHQARWQEAGHPGSFANRRFRWFQHDLMFRGVIDRRVVLLRVRHQGRTLGCLMLLVDGNRLLDYLSGFASFEETPSPGLITHFLCMQEALCRGYDAYEFLVGDQRHKDNLSTDVAHLCWATWTRPTIKMKAVDLLRRFKRRMPRLGRFVQVREEV